MDADQKKIASPYESESIVRFILVLLFAGLIVLAIGILVYFKPIGRGFTQFSGKPGIASYQTGSAHNFTPYYRARGIDPIDPAELDKTVSDNLLLLEKDPCNRPAVEAAGTALMRKRATRAAAEIYLGYSQSCPSDGDAERNAANLFFLIKDYEKARALFTSLTTRFPGNTLDWYHRGQSEHGLHMTDAAIQSFANTISLTDDQKSLGEWLFTEFSSVYAGAGRFCEAMSPLSTYLSLDPAQRDTTRLHSMLETLSQQGNCTSYASGSDSFPVLSSGVISVKAQVNGVTGTFLVDTGASFVAIGPGFAARAKITTGSDETFSTANGEAAGMVSKADTISVGKLRGDTVPLVVLGKDLKGIDGLLGRSFLSRFEMTVTKSRLTLTTRDFAKP